MPTGGLDDYPRRGTRPPIDLSRLVALLPVKPGDKGLSSSLRRVECCTSFIRPFDHSLLSPSPHHLPSPNPSPAFRSKNETKGSEPSRSSNAPINQRQRPVVVPPSYIPRTHPPVARKDCRVLVEVGALEVPGDDGGAADADLWKRRQRQAKREWGRSEGRGSRCEGGGGGGAGDREGGRREMGKRWEDVSGEREGEGGRSWEMKTKGTKTHLPALFRCAISPAGEVARLGDVAELERNVLVRRLRTRRREQRGKEERCGYVRSETRARRAKAPAVEPFAPFHVARPAGGFFPFGGDSNSGRERLPATPHHAAHPRTCLHACPPRLSPRITARISLVRTPADLRPFKAPTSPPQEIRRDASYPASGG
jgi:hypothetical protein